MEMTASIENEKRSDSPFQTVIRDAIPGYCAEDVMRKEHAADIYVYDLADGGRMVASRSSHIGGGRGEHLMEGLQDRIRRELKQYFFSYTSVPLLMDTPLGTALMIPSLAPAASLGIAVVPELPRNTLIKFCASQKFGMFQLEESLSDPVKERSFKYEEKEKIFRRLCSELNGCFGDLENSGKTREESFLKENQMIQRWLLKKLGAISNFVGCPVRLTGCDCIRSFGEFDRALYVAFLLGMLSLVREKGSDRTAEVSIESHSYGCAVSLRFELLDAMLLPDIREVMVMESIANRKNMLFERSVTGNTVCVRFVPVNRDWSYLGIKTPAAVFEKD